MSVHRELPGDIGRTTPLGEAVRTVGESLPDGSSDEKWAGRGWGLSRRLLEQRVVAGDSAIEESFLLAKIARILYGEFGRGVRRVL